MYEIKMPYCCIVVPLLFCEHVWLLLAISHGLSIGMRNEKVEQHQGNG